MNQLVFANGALQTLRSELLNDDRESAAIVLGRTVWRGTHARILVQEVYVPGEADYEERSRVSVKLKPGFCLPIEKRAKLEGWSLIYCHTHPSQEGIPSFSSIDDASEQVISIYANGRIRNVMHASLLVSADGVNCRVLGTNDSIAVIDVGHDYIVAFDPAMEVEPEIARFDRQIRAFGKSGQRRLERLRVGIVGLGGTGSVTAQQLAHLGIRNYVLVDPDLLEESNLNRVAGSSAAEIGAAKVRVAEDLIRRIQQEANIRLVQQDIVAESTIGELGDCDFLFCCTDSQASRHLLNQFAYQYFVPCIDIGAAINVAENGQAQIAGRVTMLAPGLPCLWCAEQLDAGLLRAELMSDEHVRVDPYIVGGEGERQPAVISINSTLSSLGVTMFLSAVCGIPCPSRFLIYDGNRSRVTSLAVNPNKNCNFCSTTSTLGGGDAYPLPQKKWIEPAP